MRSFFILVFLFFPFFSSSGENQIDERAKTYREEGYRLQSIGDIQSAFKYYQKAIQIEPMYVEVYNDLGVLYEAKGKDADVEEMYKKALDINSQYLPAYTNLAFYYEKRGQIENASYYWQKRYELGKEGEYWRETAKQHLEQLNLYPQFVKARQEKAAVKLIEELAYERERARLKAVEEANLHFNIGSNLFASGDYAAALKEFQISKFMNPPDEELQAKTDEFIAKTMSMQEKIKALNYTKEALDYIKGDDFLSAGEKLKDAFSVVSNISQEK